MHPDKYFDRPWVFRVITRINTKSFKKFIPIYLYFINRASTSFQRENKNKVIMFDTHKKLYCLFKLNIIITAETLQQTHYSLYELLSQLPFFLKFVYVYLYVWKTNNCYKRIHLYKWICHRSVVFVFNIVISFSFLIT